jgi:ureidoglycolate hydrolase
MVIKTTPLNAETFKDYGWVFAKDGSGPPTISNDEIDYWHNGMVLDQAPASYALSLMNVKQRKIEVKVLDVLTMSAELYLPLRHSPCILFTALSTAEDSAKPDIETIKAFYFDGPGGFAVKAGIWHYTPFPVKGDTEFILGLHDNVLIQKDGEITIDPETITYCDLEETVSVQQ